VYFGGDCLYKSRFCLWVGWCSLIQFLNFVPIRVSRFGDFLMSIAERWPWWSGFGRRRRTDGHGGLGLDEEEERTKKKKNEEEEERMEKRLCFFL
jgi:hypothetical protein